MWYTSRMLRRAVVLLLVLACAAPEPPPPTPVAPTPVEPETAAAEPAPAPEPEPVPEPPPPRTQIPDAWPYDVTAAPARNARGMVATDHELATRVGAEVLAAGGNAVDASVATAFALAVVFPQAGNLGGGGFLVYRGADGTEAALDFRETAPAAATRDMFLDPKTGLPTDTSLRGHRASGVPGSVAGLCAAHQRFGTLPWEQLLAPAQEGRDHVLADVSRLGAGVPELQGPGHGSCGQGSMWCRDLHPKDRDRALRFASPFGDQFHHLLAPLGRRPPYDDPQRVEDLLFGMSDHGRIDILISGRDHEPHQVPHQVPLAHLPSLLPSFPAQAPWATRAPMALTAASGVSYMGTPALTTRAAKGLLPISED